MAVHCTLIIKFVINIYSFMIGMGLITQVKLFVICFHLKIIHWSESNGIYFYTNIYHFNDNNLCELTKNAVGVHWSKFRNC